MYRLSARQILLIALISGLFAAGAIAVVDRISNRLQPARAAYSESAPGNITDPTLQCLGSGFWQCVIHARGRLFRGLADNPEVAKARALTLSAGTRGMNLGG